LTIGQVELDGWHPERGYEEISMRDIAHAAGVSKPLLCHYFRSKTDLFKAAIAEHAAELQSAIEPGAELQAGMTACTRPVTTS
jgi:AcrR family transcriptional regulator